MISVKYAGPFTDASGYGEATRNFIRAFHEAGANITTEKISFTGDVRFEGRNTAVAEELSGRDIDYKFKIIHTTPDVYDKYMEKGKYNIGHLFWETDRLPATWVAACNKMDEIWTGTKFNEKAIRESGVTVPITVIPQAIETVVPDYRPFRLPNFPEKDLLFYSMFDWNARKDPQTLLNAYWKAFKGHEDVGLLIKTYISGHSDVGVKKIKDDIHKWKSQFPWKDKPRVFLYTDILSTEDKHRFHETGDVFVSAHRGEGWGLPQVEALTHGKPIISTKIGGIHEYLNSKQYFPIKYSEVEIKKVYNKYYEPGMKWAQADEEHLIEMFKKIYDYYHSKNRFILSTRATSGRNLLRALFNYNMVGQTMLKRLGEIDVK